MSGTNDYQKKAIKAKLFNFRSGIDGLIQMVDGDVLDKEQVSAGLICLFNKLNQEFDSLDSTG